MTRFGGQKVEEGGYVHNSKNTVIYGHILPPLTLTCGEMIIYLIVLLCKRGGSGWRDVEHVRRKERKKLSCRLGREGPKA